MNAMNVSDRVICGAQGQACEDADSFCETLEQWLGSSTLRALIHISRIWSWKTNCLNECNCIAVVQLF